MEQFHVFAKGRRTFKVGITLFAIPQPSIRFRGLLIIIMNRVFVCAQRKLGLETGLTVVASERAVACVNLLVSPQILIS